MSIRGLYNKCKRQSKRLTLRELIVFQVAGIFVGLMMNVVWGREASIAVEEAFHSYFLLWMLFELLPVLYALYARMERIWMLLGISMACFLTVL